MKNNDQKHKSRWIQNLIEDPRIFDTIISTNSPSDAFWKVLRGVLCNLGAVQKYDDILL